jgi:mono/diheme cytochrome c family protein
MKKNCLMILLLAAAFPALALAASGEAAKIYKKSCALCHGDKGDGQGPAGKKLKATDFTDAKLMGERTDEQLADATKNGAKAKSIKVGKKMPAYGAKVKDEQIKDLVALMRSFGAAKDGDKKGKK